jgi:multidrug efflux pump subunit AcrA (membrane-fusion protein)
MMKIGKSIIAPGFAITVIAVAGVALWKGEPEIADAAAKPGLVQVKKDRLVRSILVSGELVPVRAVRITVPRFRERASIPIQAMAPEGALVKPGDSLLDVDNARLIESLSTEKINLEKAENELAKKQSEVDIQIKDLEMEFAARRLDLEKTSLKAEIPKHLLALRDWQDNQVAFEKAKKEYQSISQRLELIGKAASEELALLEVRRDQIKARIKAIETDLGALEITSTTTGTVLYENAPATWNTNPNDPPRKFQVGDQVSPGMVIMSVVDLTEMEVRAFISEVDGGLARPGQRARVAIDSHPGRELPGTIYYIPEVAERLRRLSNVRVFVGRIKLDKTDPAFMKPGMSVRAEIILDEREGLILPRSAIFEDHGKYYAKPRDGGKTEIRLLGRNATACLIEGLSEGDFVEINN